jgi:hypothetical protein
VEDKRKERTRRNSTGSVETVPIRRDREIERERETERERERLPELFELRGMFG